MDDQTKIDMAKFFVNLYKAKKYGSDHLKHVKEIQDKIQRKSCIKYRH